MLARWVKPPPGPFPPDTFAALRTYASVPANTLPKRSLNDFPTVSVSTIVPHMNATPSSTASEVRTRRPLRPRSEAIVVLNTRGLVADPLHAVEQLARGRLVDGVDDLAVVEE